MNTRLTLPKLILFLLFLAAGAAIAAGVVQASSDPLPARLPTAASAPAALPQSSPPLALPLKQPAVEQEKSSSAPQRLIPDTGQAAAAVNPLALEEVHQKSVLAIPPEGSALLVHPQSMTLPPPERWKEWPILPTLSPELRELYLSGLSRGNNPHAFSFLGDCQSQPDVFMGPYDRNSPEREDLPEHLQVTAAWFGGQFDRYNPAVKDGTTSAALLWYAWNENREGKCEGGETPLDCELRVNRPSFVIIHIGTHWESRNRGYLSTVIETVLAHGAIPVLATKSDNLEGDERLNQEMASLADEYKLPLWNFWAAVQDLENQGMRTRMYLSNEGLRVHRYSALELIDTIWRQASGE